MLFKKISIVGVGLIGGSIGMACRKKKIAKEVIGVGRRLSSIKKAKRLGAIDEGTLNLGKAAKASDLIIIATPIGIVTKKMKECAGFAKKGAIIMDVTSVKSDIVKTADKIFKGRGGISFVGTHPMAGSEESGVLVAKPDLFNNSICIVTPSESTETQALKKIKRFWQVLGAKVITMPAKKHDAAVAGISHLPHLLAYSLCAATPVRNIRLAGGSFRDITRVAKSDPKMWAEIFIKNKANIIKASNVFEKKIKLLKSDIIKNNKTKLLKRLTLVKIKRHGVG